MKHLHRHPEPDASLRKAYILAIAFNVLFLAAEAVLGWIYGSLGLLSDAGHNLADVFSLLLALFALRLAKAGPVRNFTYGYKKGTILISLLNAIILLAAAGAITVESLHKFSNPMPVDGAVVSWTAGIGIFVNGLSALLLMRKRAGRLDAESAFLHLVADALVSVGVVVSGVVMSLTGWYAADPAISLVVVAVILVSTWSLLSQSLRLSLDGIPDNIDIGGISAGVEAVPGVEGMHHMHVWPISTTEVAMTAHIVLDDIGRMEQAKREIRRLLLAEGISHATLEFERHGEVCDSKDFGLGAFSNHRLNKTK